MKKAFCLLLILMLVGTTLCCTAESSTKDEFSIRNGIHFGMTVDEVKEIEKGKPFEPLPEDYNYEQEEIFYDEGDDHITYMGFKSIAGIRAESYDGGNIIYRFINGFLDNIEYRFKVWSDNKIVESYVEVWENLTKKYGDPFNSDVASVSEICTRSTKEMIGIPDFYHIVQIDEWLKEYDDYYVVIDEVIWTDGRKNNLELSYDLITVDEMNSIKAESMQEEEEKAKEIDNDL